jgi:tetratricopeptide (TPR) repeat protein
MVDWCDSLSRATGSNLCRWGLSLLASLLSVAPARADVLTDRHSVDAQDLLAVERRHPKALAQLHQAEKLLRENKTDQAIAKLEQAKNDASSSEVLARRYCQAWMQAGERSSAIAACNEAMQRGQSPMTMRAMVGAFMMAAPTPDEVAIALKLTENAKKALSSQPWGYAAECDIARRLGDRVMYKSCLEKLETVAPGHYETLRARRLGGFAESPRWVPFAWLALLSAVLFSLGHAAWRRLARLRARGAAVASAAIVLLLVGRAPAQEGTAPPGSDAAAPRKPKMVDGTVESMAKAGGLSKWKINDAEPIKSVPTPEQRDSDPLNFGYHLMDLADKAEEAGQKGDYAQASKYWEATVVAVPDAAVGYRKTCLTAEQANDMNRAYRYCRAALGRSGVQLEDYQRFSVILMKKPTALEPQELEDLQEISKHVRAVAGGEGLADQLECEHALRLNDMQKLDTCVAKLVKGAPNDPKTITYQWAAALGHERFDEARRLIAEARKTAMAPEGVKAMESATAAQASILGRLQRRSKLVIGIAIGVGMLGMLWALARMISKRRAKVPLVAPPAQTA